jgi:phosphoenolpyruvate-protein kinase (PTS system EI component)
VLKLIAQTIAAGHAAGIAVSVCGEAGSDPQVLPLLLGLGLDEVSVGASRVGPARAWVRTLSYGFTRGLADQALQAAGPEMVAELAGPTAAGLAAR